MRRIEHIMLNIERIMQLSDEYVKRTKRQRGISEYIYAKLPENEKVSRRYILVLRRYGNFLMETGLFNVARYEDWSCVRIRQTIREITEGDKYDEGR